MRRRLNPRLAKIHRSYTVAEAAALCGVHRNTIREWIKDGLPTCDDRRPALILGRELGAFLLAKRVKNKRTCQPGEFYCMRCRDVRSAAGNMADYEPAANGAGNLVAICATCESMMCRRVSFANIDAVRGNIEVRIPQDRLQLCESISPRVNSDFSRRGQ